MEDINKKLYPLEFLEDSVETPWGHVSYQIADLGFVDSMISGGWFGGNTLSELMGTYLERVVGDDAFEYYGLQFPLLVKVMKTTGWQPLQVNVSDEVAEARYDSFGKKALWYIRKADTDASLYLGLNRDVDAAGFYSRFQDGSVKEILNEVHPSVGDVFLIEPGTVFAAGPGLEILEIGECSELTLNLETELEEAFDLIDFRKYMSGGIDPSFNVRSADPTTDFVGGPPSYVAEGGHGCRGVNAPGVTIAVCDEFKVTKLRLDGPIHIFSEQPGSFAIYHCISGEAIIQAPNESSGFDSFDLKVGKSMLLPSEVNDFMLFPAREDTVVLEALVERRSVRDSYTDDSPAEDDTPDPHVRNWN